MKKWILWASLPLVFLTSCEKQEEKSINEFAGKWIPQEVVTNGESETYTHEPCGQDYLQLNEYLSFEYMDYKTTETFNPETNQTETICEGKPVYGSYQIIDNTSIRFIQKNNLLQDGQIAIENDVLSITQTSVENEQETVKVIKYTKAE